MRKTVLITGANSGIGKAAALQFGKQGYLVILACRNLKRGKVVQKQIKDESGNQDIDLMRVSL